MRSANFPLPTDARWRRLFGVALFAGLIYTFRQLAPVFICFIILERSLSWAADGIERKTGFHRKGAIAVMLTLIAAALGTGAFFGIRRLLPTIRTIRANGAAYVDRLSNHPTYEQVKRMLHLDDQSLGDVVQQHASTAVHYATATAHGLMYPLIGVLMAIIYLFERQEIDEWFDGQPEDSILGTMFRYFGYVGDAIAITVRMQVVVAVVNAIITLPVLIFLGLPHIPLLALLILISGLLPVVGNVISGAVLCYVAFVEKGAWAVAVFLVVTFVLHKIESYYLNPRLATQHVKLPGLVLVISLLLFEKLFGFIGLFLSFPTLYVAIRIHNEWKQNVVPSSDSSRAEPPEPTDHATDPAT